jgi:hypothetical protein
MQEFPALIYLPLTRDEARLVRRLLDREVFSERKRELDLEPPPSRTENEYRDCTIKRSTYQALSSKIFCLLGFK